MNIWRGDGTSGVHRVLGAIIVTYAWACGCVQPDSEPATHREVPEQRQFDFWLGQWELTWGDSGSGTNTIVALLDSMVIAESFDGTPAIALMGLSHSVYDRRAGQWKQTWVDNQGGYLDFVGGLEDGKMILARNGVGRDDTPIMQRMVWYNITHNELDWNWESSADDGETWQTNWEIHYRRKR